MPQTSTATSTSLSAKDHLIHMLKKRRKSKFAIPHGTPGAGTGVKGPHRVSHHHLHQLHREDLSSMSSLNSNSRAQPVFPNRHRLLGQKPLVPDSTTDGAVGGGSSGQSVNEGAALKTVATVEVVDGAQRRVQVRDLVDMIFLRKNNSRSNIDRKKKKG